MRDLPRLDQDGLYRVPSRLYWLFLLLLRPYLCWIITLAMPADQRQVLAWFYPVSADFLRALLIAAPAVLLLAVLTQRVPYDPKLRRGRAWRFWFFCWRQSRWLLILNVVFDLYWTLQHLPSFVSVKAPWLLIAPIALVMALIYLLKSSQLPLVFNEWPEQKHPPTEVEQSADLN
jgi:hypothetical protein